ncbi:MAG: amidophosphoribosyltransferase [Chitinophagales bacterium]|nr:amidophosphoribosyltransferase [Chitinophagales bacterium]MDW8393040.1 amidophosphoribosyltransferase [Chitinophagales bacterium]
MSEAIGHECGVALIRLLRPLPYYKERYGTLLYGLNKLYLLMEKQHNRGQDGAGIGSIKLQAAPGSRFMSRYRSNSPLAIAEIFQKIYRRLDQVAASNSSLVEDADWMAKNVSFIAEQLLGHLRYGTYGRNEIDSCHPFLQNPNSALRALLMAGNFNLTNISELRPSASSLAERPDTSVVVECVAAELDRELEQVRMRQMDNRAVAVADLHRRMDFPAVLRRAASRFDGGYVLAGLTGLGFSFTLRDPWGIRPAFYLHNEEVLAVASERPALQTAFHVAADQIHELPPGAAVIADRNGSVSVSQILEPQQRRSCSFERIYFSRGSDVQIYQERKRLGHFLVPAVLKAIDYDLEHTVFSFIPNTAEVAFLGLLEGIEQHLQSYKFGRIRSADLADDELKKLLQLRPRIEKIAIKDVKLRTFITQDTSRNELVQHVYDITYGSIRRGEDTLVVLDDSIVRGTTLKQSIIRMLDRLGPRKIIIVSSAPQIRYPDCYGIDMSKMNDFIAFRALISLLRKKGLDNKLDDVYESCRRQMDWMPEQRFNAVKVLYELVSDEELSEEIARLIRDDDVQAETQVIFQTIPDLHRACPDHLGDWYFSGDYPTPGGVTVVNRAFMNFMEGKDVRAYT